MVNAAQRTSHNVGTILVEDATAIPGGRAIRSSSLNKIALRAVFRLHDMLLLGIIDELGFMGLLRSETLTEASLICEERWLTDVA